MLKQSNPFPEVEVTIKRVSLLISLVSVSLMLGGLLGYIGEHGVPTWPGESVATLSGFWSARHRFSVPVLSMSAGIVLLALLPAIRVLLALGIYARGRRATDALITLIVLIELLASMLGMAA